MRRIIATALGLAAIMLAGGLGASDLDHWAFQPRANPAPPPVHDSGWVQQPLDRFILARLEQRGIRPSPALKPRQFARRASFSLTGLPPPPELVENYAKAPTREAKKRLVASLLASPSYGERWGRHWLDIARYGDSNGGDENHAYPHAYRYRDWVIKAFNEDLPFDQFIARQLAGDLLAAGNDEEQAEAIAATGFLAIGTKILAEQDPVKKRADIVDEQIDAFSKTFLGLTVACARCHDHKFDPIPTADYYALAGIFHSTAIEDRPLETTAYQTQRQAFERESLRLESELAAARSALSALEDEENRITREAESFDRGNVIIDDERYGKGIGVISDPGGQKNFAEFDIQFPSDGHWKVELRYAAATARPGRLLVDGADLKDGAIASDTGGWQPDDQRWHVEGVFPIGAGRRVFRIESEPMMSHIDKIRFTPINASTNTNLLLARVAKTEEALAARVKRRPSPPIAMGVRDDNPADAKIHRRGDHRSLGAVAPRGALSLFGPKMATAPDESSGREQLADWLARPDHPLTARVIVNRVWRWHFGRGLVLTTENFGLNGEPPTHPLLLDFLANELIKNNWSIKTLHRQIVLSSAFELGSSPNLDAARVDPANRLLWRRKPIRLEAEAIRDALLAVSGQLALRGGGRPPSVKAQDPSPEDLAKNQAVYDNSGLRSVYLPIVRSNVYPFFSLFNFPDATAPTGNRHNTITPTQSLLLMNSAVTDRASRAAVELLMPCDNDHSMIKRLYSRLFQRQPSERERVICEEFLEAYRGDDNSPRSRRTAWEALCHSLMMSDEFIHSP